MMIAGLGGGGKEDLPSNFLKGRGERECIGFCSVSVCRSLMCVVSVVRTLMRCDVYDFVVALSFICVCDCFSFRFRYFRLVINCIIYVISCFINSAFPFLRSLSEHPSHSSIFERYSPCPTTPLSARSVFTHVPMLGVWRPS